MFINVIGGMDSYGVSLSAASILSDIIHVEVYDACDITPVDILCQRHMILSQLPGNVLTDQYGRWMDPRHPNPFRESLYTSLPSSLFQPRTTHGWRHHVRAFSSCCSSYLLYGRGFSGMSYSRLTMSIHIENEI